MKKTNDTKESHLSVLENTDDWALWFRKKMLSVRTL